MTQIIIDTREDYEYAESHVDGAINIPPAQFMTGNIPTELKDVAKDASIIVYCRSGSRSNVVGHVLRQFGFTNITNGINQGRVEQLLDQ
jgi:phage shock protein E